MVSESGSINSIGTTTENEKQSKTTEKKKKGKNSQKFWTVVRVKKSIIYDMRTNYTAKSNVTTQHSTTGITKIYTLF